MLRELEIQKLLRKNNIEGTEESLNTLDLKDTFNIKYSLYEGYVLFKYNLIIQGFTDLTKQTRGVILDSQNNWEVVNYPFEKFFNLGESPSPNIDWTSAKFIEKLDGSIIYVWWADRLLKWMFSTSGTCNAYSAEADFNKSFGEICEGAFINHKIRLQNFNKQICYMFELQSQYNEIVVRQADNDGEVTLIGARNLNTFQEYNIHNDIIFHDNNDSPKMVEYFDLNQDNVLDFVNSRPSSESEGLVIVDKDFNRIKIKSKEYVLAHKTKDSIISSWKNVVSIVLSDSIDDLMPLLTDTEKERIDRVKSLLDLLKNDYENFVGENGTLERKDMGLILKDDPDTQRTLGSFVWACHYGDMAFSEQLKRTNPEKLVDIFKLK